MSDASLLINLKKPPKGAADVRLKNYGAFEIYHVDFARPGLA
jgi:hypothetical protein